MIQIRCTCGNVLRVPEERAGQTGKCPSCGQAITVPDIASEEVATQLRKTVGEQSITVKRKRFSPVGLIIYLIFFALVALCVLMATSSFFDTYPEAVCIKSYYKYKIQLLIQSKSQHTLPSDKDKSGK